MAEDLAELLERLGYLSAPSAEPTQKAGAGRYLLRLRVEEYQGVSRAASMINGVAGAGMASLHVHYELEGLVGTVQKGEPRVSGAPDWSKAARVVNKQIRDAVNGALRLVH